MPPPEEGSDGRVHSDLSFEVTSAERNLFPDAPLVRVNERDEWGRYFMQKFFNGMLTLGLRTRVEAFYKQFFPTITLQARVETFAFMSKVMERIHVGYGKDQFVWFGGSKDEINIILKYGFPSKGPAIFLSPLDSPLASLRSCVADENGLYHFILCRVLLGRSEVVSPATLQRSPSSEEFHSGVDNLLSPHVYMVWSTNMNTNILPQYVVSFIPPVPLKVNVAAEIVNVSTAPQAEPKVDFFMLLYELTTELPMITIRTLLQLRRDIQEGRMTVLEFRRKIVELVRLPLLNRTLRKIKAGNFAPNNRSASEKETRDISNAVLPQIDTGNLAPNKGSASEKETWDINNVILPQIDVRNFAPNNRSRGVLPQHGQSRISCSSSNRVSKTSILPQNVVRFRPPVPITEKVDSVSSSPAVRRECNTTIPFNMLLIELTMLLPMHTIRTVLMLFRDHKEGKIGHLEFKRKFEEIVGLDMLKRACRSLLMSSCN